MTLRQDIEKIESCRHLLPSICRPKDFSQEICNKYNDCVECHTDRIIDLIGKTAEVMEIVIGGGDKQWNRAVAECQDYWQKELGK